MERASSPTPSNYSTMTDSGITDLESALERISTLRVQLMEEKAARLNAEAQATEEQHGRALAEREVARVRKELLALQVEVDARARAGAMSAEEQSDRDVEAERMHGEMDVLEQRVRAIAAANKNVVREREELRRRYVGIEDQLREKEDELRRRAETIDRLSTAATSRSAGGDPVDMERLRAENRRLSQQLEQETRTRRRLEQVQERTVQQQQASERALQARDAAEVLSLKREKELADKRSRELAVREKQAKSTAEGHGAKVSAQLVSAEESGKEMEQNLKRLLDAVASNGRTLDTGLLTGGTPSSDRQLRRRSSAHSASSDAPGTPAKRKTAVVPTTPTGPRWR